MALFAMLISRPTELNDDRPITTEEMQALFGPLSPNLTISMNGNHVVFTGPDDEVEAMRLLLEETIFEVDIYGQTNDGTF